MNEEEEKYLEIDIKGLVDEEMADKAIGADKLKKV